MTLLWIKNKKNPVVTTKLTMTTVDSERTQDLLILTDLYFRIEKSRVWFMRINLQDYVTIKGPIYHSNKIYSRRILVLLGLRLSLCCTYQVRFDVCKRGRENIIEVLLLRDSELNKFHMSDIVWKREIPRFFHFLKIFLIRHDHNLSWTHHSLFQIKKIRVLSRVVSLKSVVQSEVISLKYLSQSSSQDQNHLASGQEFIVLVSWLYYCFLLPSTMELRRKE